MKEINIAKQTKSYSVIEVGQLSEVYDYIYQPNPNFKIDGKVFIKEALDMTSSEISFNSMHPNTTIVFFT